MKKLAIIGTVGLPANYGGFETLANYLVPTLTKTYNTTVFCSTKGYKKSERLKKYKGAKLYFLPLNANGVNSIFYDMLSMIIAVFKHDILLVLGVSGALLFPVIKLLTKRKIIVNIDGIEWKRNKWSKPAKMFLKYSEKIAVKYANVVVCDNKAVLDYVWEEYGVKGKLIAYGGDHVKKLPITKELKTKYPFINGKYAFKVARIEPENNIHIILKAFSGIKHQLIIIGNWNKSEYGISLKNKYKNSSNIHLLDPIYDLKILDQFRTNCSVYVHGHSAGGTNPSLVEAMNLGLPIIAFDVTFNKETTLNKALYFNSIEDLKLKIQNITIEEKNKVAKEMEGIGSKHYAWQNIIESYVELLKELTSDSIIKTEIINQI